MKKQFNHKNLLLWGLTALFATQVPLAKAQTVVVDQPLSFGQIVIVDFNTIAEITIQTNGTYVKNSNTYVIIDPTRGEYTLTGAPASSTYTITVPSSVTIGGGPGGGFTLDNITVRPTTLVTNGSGEDQFELTGRLRSAGGGTFYGDGTYSDNFTITFNF